MIRFEEMVKQDTPRLVVTCGRSANGDESFQWGVVGHIPLLSAIGALAEMQARIISGEYVDECPHRAVVIAWVDGCFEYFVHQDVCIEATVGMLELIKNTLVDTHRARQMANQQVVLGPDGSPYRQRH